MQEYLGSIPGLGRSLGEGKGYPLQYSGLENSMECIGSQIVGHSWGSFTFFMEDFKSQAEGTGFILFRNSGMAGPYQLSSGEINRKVIWGWASLVAQKVKNLPTMKGTWVWSLGRDAPLEKGMATHFSILAWRIPQVEESGRLYIVHRVAKNGAANTFTFHIGWTRGRQWKEHRRIKR